MTTFRFLLIGVFLSWISNSVLAANISSDIRNGEKIGADNNGGYLDLGIGAIYYKSPIYGYPEGNSKEDNQFEKELYLNINGRFQYNGYFVEAYSEALEGFTLGYNFWYDEKWSFDILAADLHESFSEETSDDWKELKERSDDFNIGIRGSYINTKYLMQFQLVNDVSNSHKGQIASWLIGKNWQYRNWNIHALIGLQYSSAKVNDYYFGIDTDESASGFLPFKASAGVDAISEMGVTYPISENWIFRSMYRYTRLDEGLEKSPLITNLNAQQINMYFSYVF